MSSTLDTAVLALAKLPKERATRSLCSLVTIAVAWPALGMQAGVPRG